ncbi:MAG: dTDP-4-dehydrorhamnose 3,5-epimerase [Deltaproteobacteria bacterium]|jgi:dTDP-4-dehydrorhamnose 3,5-epimerase|nr:dTDP-4-dehydrorhamnose 3,5-epimerase [Deltaproteobacteria bacterium]
MTFNIALNALFLSFLRPLRLTQKIMRYLKTALKDVLVLVQEPIPDNRGFFARAFSQDELQKEGLDFPIRQINRSYNRLKGTLRGLHFQNPPHAEDKIIQVTKGSIIDVALDIRPGSPTFGQHHAEILTAANGRALLIPKGCAHGFQTLEDDTELYYLVSAYYAPGADSGIRWDNPGLNIAWPTQPPTVISDKDKAWPDVAL